MLLLGDLLRILLKLLGNRRLLGLGRLNHGLLGFVRNQVPHLFLHGFFSHFLAHWLLLLLRLQGGLLSLDLGLSCCFAASHFGPHSHDGVFAVGFQHGLSLLCGRVQHGLGDSGGSPLAFLFGFLTLKLADLFLDLTSRFLHPLNRLSLLFLGFLHCNLHRLLGLHSLLGDLMIDPVLFLAASIRLLVLELGDFGFRLILDLLGLGFGHCLRLGHRLLHLLLGGFVHHNHLRLHVRLVLGRHLFLLLLLRLLLGLLNLPSFLLHCLGLSLCLLLLFLGSLFQRLLLLHLRLQLLHDGLLHRLLLRAQLLLQLRLFLFGGSLRQLFLELLLLLHLLLHKDLFRDDFLLRLLLPALGLLLSFGLSGFLTQLHDLLRDLLLDFHSLFRSCLGLFLCDFDLQLRVLLRLLLLRLLHLQNIRLRGCNLLLELLFSLRNLIHLLLLLISHFPCKLHLLLRRLFSLGDFFISLVLDTSNLLLKSVLFLLLFCHFGPGVEFLKFIL